MFEKSYYKSVQLPSNGLIYDSFIKIKNLETSFLFPLNDPFFSSSQTDLIQSVINNHIIINFNIEEMYFSDLFFLWVMLFYSALNSDKIEFKTKCSQCGMTQRIEIPIQDLDIKYRTDETKEFSIIDYEDISIIYEFRKIKHNILSNTLFLSDESADNIKYFCNYIKPQIIKIVKNDKEYSNEYLEKLINYKGTDLINILNDYIKHEPFGIQNNIFSSCSFCKKTEEILIIDPFSYSLSFEPDLNEKLLKQAVETIILMSKSKYLTAAEICRIPYSNLALVQNVLAETIKKSSSSKDYLDNPDLNDLF